jgi:hypothetical protein
MPDASVRSADRGPRRLHTLLLDDDAEAAAHA